MIMILCVYMINDYYETVKARASHAFEYYMNYNKK